MTALSELACRIVFTEPTAECWNSWKVMGKLFTVYYLTQLRLIHPCRHRSEGSLSTFPRAAHSWPFGCDLLPRRLQQFVPSSLFSSSRLPSCSLSHSDLFYAISLCFVCFPVTPFIFQSVWPHIIFKVDPNAFPGSCRHALPVSLRHKSNI